jgi:hypothetical protein
LTGASGAGDTNLTAGPREMPRVANAPAAGGKAASAGVISGEFWANAAIQAWLITTAAAIKNLIIFFSSHALLRASRKMRPYQVDQSD